MVEEKISCRIHIQTIENNLSKILDYLYRVKQLLSQRSLKNIYLSYIHSYLIMLRLHGEPPM